MIININNDIQLYEKTEVNGFSLNELVSGIIAAVICAVISLCNYFLLHMSLEFSIYLVIPLFLVILGLGMINVEGMSAIELIRAYYNCNLRGGERLRFSSLELEKAQIYLEEMEEENVCKK